MLAIPATVMLAVADELPTSLLTVQVIEVFSLTGTTTEVPFSPSNSSPLADQLYLNDVLVGLAAEQVNVISVPLATCPEGTAVMLTFLGEQSSPVCDVEVQVCTWVGSLWWGVHRWVLCGGGCTGGYCVVEGAQVGAVWWRVYRWVLCGGGCTGGCCVVEGVQVGAVWWRVYRWVLCGGGCTGTG